MNNIPPPPPPPPNAQPLPSPPFHPPGPNSFHGNGFHGEPPNQQFGAMNLNGPPNGMRQSTQMGAQRLHPSVVPILYEGYQLKKEDPNFLGDEPNWSRIVKAPISVAQDELIKMVKKQQRKGEGSAYKDYNKLKSENQRSQVDRLVAERAASEHLPNADWIYVSVEDVRGLAKNKRDEETKKIIVILKRQDRSKSATSKNRTNSLTTEPRVSSFPSGRVVDLNEPVRPMGNPNFNNGQGMYSGPQGGPPGGPPRGFPPGPFPPNGPGPRPGPGPIQHGPPFPNGPPPGPPFHPPPNSFPPPNHQPPMNRPPQMPMPMPRMPPGSPDSDEIVQVIDPRPPMNRGNSMGGGRPYPQGPPMNHQMPRKSSMKKPRPIVTNTYDSGNSSDESNGFSRGSVDRSTPLSTPTSGGGGIPRERRFSSGVDFMVKDKKYPGRSSPNGRRPSMHGRNSWDEIPNRSTGARRGSSSYNDRSRPSDALVRNMSRTDMEERERQRELDHLRVLEQVNRNERRRIDETMKVIGSYGQRRRESEERRRDDEYDDRRRDSDRDRSPSYDRRSTGRRSPDRNRRSSRQYSPDRYPPPPRRGSSYRGYY